MKTDIWLKVLTSLRGADLLPLLGMPAATLLRVESRDLPATTTELDTLFHVRSPQGQTYLHVVEWQGYRDPTVLWRLVGYMAWLGQQEPDMMIVGTVVYLAPGYDMGDTITQTIDGQVVQSWTVGRIALWEQDAQAALASGALGLAVLSPLMRGADAALVETAAQMVVAQAPLTQQDNLLAILGTFALPLMDTQRVIDVVGKERLMRSDLFDYLIKDREAELQTQYRQELHQLLEDTLLVRFPTIPFALVHAIRDIKQTAELRQLIVAVQRAADQAAAEQLLQDASQQANGQ